MTLRTRVAIVGLGSMGRNHLRVLSAMTEIEIVAISDVDTERIPAGPWKRFSTHTDIASEALDYCVIASPTPTHAEIALFCIERGVPLLVEKPLASTSGEARTIADAAKGKASRIAVGMIERFNRTVIEAKRICESNQFGKLLKVATRRVGPPPGRDMGNGVLLDLGIHDLDLVRWVTGQKLVDSQSRFVSGAVSPYDDLALVSGRLASGALCNTEVSWLAPTKERNVELLFKQARINFNLLTGEIEIVRQLGEETQWDAVRELRGPRNSTSMVYGVKTVEPLVLMHKTLLAAVLSGDWSAMPQVDDSVEVLSLIEQLQQR